MEEEEEEEEEGAYGERKAGITEGVMPFFLHSSLPFFSLLHASYVCFSHGRGKK